MGEHLWPIHSALERDAVLTRTPWMNLKSITPRDTRGHMSGDPFLGTIQNKQVHADRKQTGVSGGRSGGGGRGGWGLTAPGMGFPPWRWKPLGTGRRGQFHIAKRLILCRVNSPSLYFLKVLSTLPDTLSSRDAARRLGWPANLSPPTPSVRGLVPSAPRHNSRGVFLHWKHLCEALFQSRNGLRDPLPIEGGLCPSPWSWVGCDASSSSRG